jgi:imidazolonepropionase-like amidohydrolase
MSEFVIVNATVFDGERVLGKVDVHVAGEVIASVGGSRPDGVELVNGEGATLLPGLADAHTHSDSAALRQALTFGVTTEFDMASMPGTMILLRRKVAESRDLADVRSASVALTPPGGHPHQLRRGQNDPDWPTATRVQEVPGFVDDRITEGADYIKVIVEDGHVLGVSVPTLAPELLAATAQAGHARGKMVLAHALTLEATTQAVAAGVDGLTHLFVDTAHTPGIVERIATSGAFVVPTLSTLASITGQSAGADLARDARVRPKISPEWLESLSQTYDTMPSPNFDTALATVAALHTAGVDLLAGTDAAHLGVPGTAHGASLHDELRLLVRAGLSPVEALRAATSLPARCFGLTDRGRVQEGCRADLLLVDGNPTANIGDTLSIRAVWRQGVRLALDPVSPSADRQQEGLAHE